MIVTGSNYWNLGMGLKEGEVARDQEGLEAMRILIQNTAFVIRKIHE